jgi:hypothetical protein
LHERKENFFFCLVFACESLEEKSTKQKKKNQAKPWQKFVPGSKCKEFRVSMEHSPLLASQKMPEFPVSPAKFHETSKKEKKKKIL